MNEIWTNEKLWKGGGKQGGSGMLTKNERKFLHKIIRKGEITLKDFFKCFFAEKKQNKK